MSTQVAISVDAPGKVNLYLAVGTSARTATTR